MNENPDLHCIELVELTTEYFEGALPPAEAARLEAHLAICPGCEEYLQQMRVTQETLGRPDASVLEEPSRDKLLEVFRAWKAGENPGGADGHG